MAGPQTPPSKPPGVTGVTVVEVTTQTVPWKAPAVSELQEGKGGGILSP